MVDIKGQKHRAPLGVMTAALMKGAQGATGGAEFKSTGQALIMAVGGGGGVSKPLTTAANPAVCFLKYNQTD